MLFVLKKIYFHSPNTLILDLILQNNKNWVVGDMNLTIQKVQPEMYANTLNCGLNFKPIDKIIKFCQLENQN